MYYLYQTGTGSGTFPECWGTWGAARTSKGVLIHKSIRLQPVVELALKKFPDHDDWNIYRGNDTKPIMGFRHEARRWLATYHPKGTK